MPDIINSVKEEFINEYIRKIDTAIETYNATIGSNDEIFDLVIEISNVFENDIPNLQTSVLIRTGTEIRDANIVRAMLIKYLADNGIEYKGKGIEENVKEKRFWNSFIHWFETELPGLELLDGKYLRWDNWDGGMWFIELDYDHEFTLYRGTVYPSSLKNNTGGKVYAVVKKELDELMKLSNEYFDVRHNDYLNAAKEKREPLNDSQFIHNMK